MVIKKSRVVCLDTGVLFGLGRKMIREIKEDRKPRKKLKEIKEDGILMKIHNCTDVKFTTIITPYEFVKEMVKAEGVDITLARMVYEKIKEEFEIREIIPDKKWRMLTPDLMNKFNKLKIDLADGLHIYIASKLNIPFITSESNRNNKVDNFKELYSEVYTVTEYLNANN